MNRRAPARAIALLAVAAAVSGCFGAAPPVPRDHYYRIIVPAPRQDQPSAFPGVISVAPLEADGLLRERPILFSASGKVHEMQQHDYHYWIDPPPRMLQAQLVAYLRRAGVARSVITPALRIGADFEVTGRIRRLERLMGDGPPRVAVEIELAMVASDRSRLVVIDTYAAEARSRDQNVESSILALNEAVAEIFEAFVADASRRYTAQNPTSKPN